MFVTDSDQTVIRVRISERKIVIYKHNIHT